MRYEIQGETLPVVICYLDGGEKCGFRQCRSVMWQEHCAHICHHLENRKDA